jgi:hypothetical protein
VCAAAIGTKLVDESLIPERSGTVEREVWPSPYLSALEGRHPDVQVVAREVDAIEELVHRPRVGTATDRLALTPGALRLDLRGNRRQDSVAST